MSVFPSPLLLDHAEEELLRVRLKTKCINLVIWLNLVIHLIEAHFGIPHC